MGLKISNKSSIRYSGPTEWLLSNQFSHYHGSSQKMSLWLKKNQIQVSRKLWWTYTIFYWKPISQCCLVYQATSSIKYSMRWSYLVWQTYPLKRTEQSTSQWKEKKDNYISSFPLRSRYLQSKLPRRSLLFAKAIWSWIKLS